MGSSSFLKKLKWHIECNKDKMPLSEYKKLSRYISDMEKIEREQRLAERNRKEEEARLKAEKEKREKAEEEKHKNMLRRLPLWTCLLTGTTYIQKMKGLMVFMLKA